MSKDRWWLACCVCLYVNAGAATPAITVIDGYAVCEDHMGLVAQGMEWNRIYGTARRSGERSP